MQESLESQSTYYLVGRINIIAGRLQEVLDDPYRQYDSGEFAQSRNVLPHRDWEDANQTISYCYYSSCHAKLVRDK
jgi:hypothetical protein